MGKADKEEIKWNPRMPDRRRGERREPLPEDANGKLLNISDATVQGERRMSRGRRQSDRQRTTFTLTGRAMDVKH